VLVPKEAIDVVVQVAQFGIPKTAVPPDGVATVVPVHEKQVVPAKTYPELQVKAVKTPAAVMLHVAIPADCPVTPEVAVVAVHGTQADVLDQ